MKMIPEEEIKATVEDLLIGAAIESVVNTIVTAVETSAKEQPVLEEYKMRIYLGIVQTLENEVLNKGGELKVE